MYAHYWIIFSAICTGTLCYNYSKFFRTPFFYYCFAALLIQLAGFRSEQVGRDYIVYRDYFELAPNLIGSHFHKEWLSTLPNVDIGYVYLNSFFKFLGLQFEELIFFAALFSISAYTSFYYKTTKQPFIALTMYYVHTFFYREMIQLRAGMSCAILLWCFYNIGKKNYTLAIILLLTAISLHLSAILALIPISVFIFTKSINLKYIIISTLLASCLSFFINPNSEIFSLIDRIEIYKNSEYSNAVGIMNNPVTIKQIIILLSTYIVIFNKTDVPISSNFRVCFTSYWFATLWIIVFNKFEILGARGASFLSVTEPLLVAETIHTVLNKISYSIYRNIIITAFLILCSAILYLNLEIKGVVDKYVSIFS